MKPIIEINHLGKKYPIRVRKPYLSFRERLSDPFRPSLWKKTFRDEFWALEGINLKVNAGERLAIVGNNGAGKSTLLKILSRITWPSAGNITIRGKLSSLLEVGTGFHPELTGRENIFLNASILGLKSSQIRKHFDSIVDFSGVETFIDTPLKSYSTGMALRLAFAVAAHIEPEILIIDEVLAGGDLTFQAKCINKMKELSNNYGRTILLVSHNMNHISELCSNAIWLHEGKLVKAGSVQEIVSAYVNQGTVQSARREWEGNSRPGNEIVRLNAVRLIDRNNKEKVSFSTSEMIGIQMQYEVLSDGHVLWLGHNLYNHTGINVFDTHSVKSDYYRQPHQKGKFESLVWIPRDLLNTGTYYIGCAIFNHSEHIIYFHERDILRFDVFDSAAEITARGATMTDFPGVVRPLLDWTIVKL